MLLQNDERLMSRKTLFVNLWLNIPCKAELSFFAVSLNLF